MSDVNEILNVQCTHCGEFSEYELPSSKMIVNRDSFTDDLLNRGYTKGYQQGREDAIEEVIRHSSKEFQAWSDDYVCEIWLSKLVELKENQK